MLVRLAVGWTDPFGIAHGSGELVDVDAITLAELEQQGMVETMSEQQSWIGPGSPEPASTQTDAETVTEKGKPTDPGSAQPDSTQANAWIGPGSTEQ